VIKDPNSENVFSLLPLKRSDGDGPYLVHANNTTFKVSMSLKLITKFSHCKTIVICGALMS